MENINDISREGDASILRLLFGAVPVLGPVINEVIEIRGRIRQERLNKFVEMLAEGFTGSTQINDAVLRQEDFIDLFETVLKRVVQTKSESKHKHYRDIILNQVKSAFSDSDKADIYLDLIASLSEIEILILFSHKVFDRDFLRKKEDMDSYRKEEELLKTQLKEEVKLSQEGSANNKSKVQDDLYRLSELIEAMKRESDELNIYRKAEFYKIDNNKFNYHKQNLYSKALLIDTGIGTFGYSPFTYMGITEFGKEFLLFLTTKS